MTTIVEVVVLPAVLGVVGTVVEVSGDELVVLSGTVVEVVARGRVVDVS